MPTTIRISEPRELLALVPYQLGFRPSDSAVLVSLRGGRSRVGLVARVDLSDLADPCAGPALASAVVGHVVADGATTGVVVVYTAEDLQEPAPPGSTAARVLVAVERLAQIADPHLGHLARWVVGPAGYYGLGCTDRDCCPRGGRPLSELEATQVGAQMVLEGVGIAPSRDRLVCLPAVEPGARRSARRARARWAGRGAEAAGTTEVHRWRREGLALWRAELARARREMWAVPGPDTPPPFHPAAERAGSEVARGAAGLGAPHGGTSPGLREGGWVPTASATAGRLLAALDDVLVRDAVLLTFVPGADRVADRLVAGGDDDTGVGQALGVLVDPAQGRPPEEGRAVAAEAVLECLAAHAPKEAHAPSLALLAVLAWWRGDGARAGLLVDRALAVDPGYRLAHLLEDALRAGMPPGWVRAGRSSD